MSSMKMIWLPAAEADFKRILNRAKEKGKFREFAEAHNEIVKIIRDEETAFAKGEILFNTKTPGGEVRILVRDGISICYAVFRIEKAGWILKYQTAPGIWPFTSE